MKIVIMGPQGSGKSTQAALLAEKLHLPHLAIGDLSRQLSQKKTALAKKIKSYLDRGELFPDQLLMRILKTEISKPKYRKGFIADGTPRTLKQAKILPFKADKIFYLAVSDKENIKRLVQRGREDDTPPLIKRRLALYHQETEPVLAFYRQQGLLTEVDGERSVETIHQDILKRVKA